MDCAYLVLKGDRMEEELASEGEKEVEQVELTAEEYLDGQQDEFLREVFSYAVRDEFEEDEENNQFSSVISTLSWKQLLHIDGNITFACRWQT